MFYFPFRYVDRSKFNKIDELLQIDGPAQIKGRIIGIQESGAGRNKRLNAKFQDETGLIDLVWFRGINWVKGLLKVNEEIVIYGRMNEYKGRWNMPHPEITELKDLKPGLQPIYGSTEKLSANGFHSKGIEKLIKELLLQPIDFEEYIPEALREQEQLIGITKAIHWVHQPKTMEEAQKARFRLKFEELFFLQMELLLRKQINLQKSVGHRFQKVGPHFNRYFEEFLKFDLTGAQKRVLKEIRLDMNSGHHMNRLVQGDVGSGKTLVALFTILIAIDNGFQGAFMAPTEILANQHFSAIAADLEMLGLKVELLTGSTKKKDRERIHSGLLSGEVHVLVGTHALLEDEVRFSNLGLVVIDEQHRFGVAQRAKMRRKNDIAPHVLIMTATPIPRTLAMTYYGDLDVSLIDEMPPGRKPITTRHAYDSSRLRLFGFLKEEIERGRQVYIVYPLIHESEKLDYNNLMSGFEAITRAFPLPKYKVSIVHGKMKSEDKDFEMGRFTKCETNIMVATTVIEVGVNVPNASVMVIESAERFGLSQLHQLRGRVGRGAEKSYCILMTGDKLSPDSLKRMRIMVETNDGFKIADADLRLRGPGDLMGTQQSGILDLKIADISKDGQLVALCRTCAQKILKDDPSLILETNNGIRRKLVDLLKNKPDWGKIA